MPYKQKVVYQSEKTIDDAILKDIKKYDKNEKNGEGSKKKKSYLKDGKKERKGSNLDQYVKIIL